MMKKDNHFPYMIAYGPTKDNIECYYIEVEKQLIKVRLTPKIVGDYVFEHTTYLFQMPNGNNILQTFDIYFKVHKIFNLNFDKNIMNAMHFVQYYVYKMEEDNVKMTTRMEDVYNRIIRYMPTT